MGKYPGGRGSLRAGETPANALYADCLAIQNAARLEYPAKVAGQPAHATERARFLLDELPPRERNEADGGTPPPVPAEPLRRSMQ